MPRGTAQAHLPVEGEAWAGEVQLAALLALTNTHFSVFSSVTYCAHVLRFTQAALVRHWLAGAAITSTNHEPPGDRPMFINRGINSAVTGWGQGDGMTPEWR